MGWETELQQASFRGVLFDCLSTNESTTKALAIQQAPYSNDAFIEDMGNDPEKISLRMFLAGSEYRVYLDALKTALAYKGEGELVHPVWGIKKVYVQNWNVVHDTNTVDGCEVSADFLIAKAENKQLFIPVPTEINHAKILDFPAIAFEKELNQLKKLDPNKYFKIINRVRNGLQQARKILGSVRSTIDNILSPPKWAVGLINDVVRLATFDVTNISAISKWRSLIDRVKRVAKIFDDADSSNDSHAFKQLWRAVSIASNAAVAQSVVKQVRSTTAKNQSNYNATSAAQIGSNQTNDIKFVMTPIDLAIIRQQVRQDIQQAIKTERETTQQQAAQANIDPAQQVARYKTLAEEVHDQIQALIETRPPIRHTPILLHCTAHWLAHQLYGDMNRAEEIKHLNPTVSNFALLRSGMELITYAR